MFIVRLILLVAVLVAVPASAGASVLVTIKPVHSIVASVTKGVSEPALLLDGTVSPHLDRIKPSTLRALRKADLVVWVGEGVETFLSSAIAQLPESIAVITLSESELPLQLPLRDSHAKHGHIDHHNDSENQLDAHLWFDPYNAAAIADLVASKLTEIDPAHARQYAANSQRFKDTLTTAVDELQAQLSDVTTVPFLVFHDALQYLEHRFSLSNAGVVTYQPQVAASAGRLKDLQQLIETQSIRCILTEPQLESRTVRSVVNNTDIRYAVVDPLASQMDSGPGLYLAWLTATLNTIHDCLLYNPVQVDPVQVDPIQVD